MIGAQTLARFPDVAGAWLQHIVGIRVGRCLAIRSAARTSGYYALCSPWRSRRARVAHNSLMQHQRAILAGADAVHVMTRVEAEGFVSWGVQPRRVVEAGGGVDQLPPLQNTRDRVAELGIRPPFVLFLGRATYDKGAQHAVRSSAIRQQESLSGSSSPVPQLRTFSPSRAWMRSAPASGRPASSMSKTCPVGGRALLHHRGRARWVSSSRGLEPRRPSAQRRGIPSSITGKRPAFPFGDVAPRGQRPPVVTNSELRRACGWGVKVARDTWSQVRDRVLDSYRQLLD